MPEVRVHRDRIRKRRERGGVGAGGRRDVTALRVGDHEEPRRTGVFADLGERLPARRPLRLEEGRLGLDSDRGPGHGVDNPATELDDAETGGHQRGIGVEADAKRRALALHGGSEPIREMSRRPHASQDTRRPGRRGRPEAASRSSEEMWPFRALIASRTTSA